MARTPPTSIELAHLDGLRVVVFAKNGTLIHRLPYASLSAAMGQARTMSEDHLVLIAYDGKQLACFVNGQEVEGQAVRPELTRIICEQDDQRRNAA